MVSSTSGKAATALPFKKCGHRWKQPDLERPIKVNIVLPIVFFVVCSFLILMPIFEEPEVSRHQLESLNIFRSDERPCVGVFIIRL